jgi:ATP/maltotriose-dependent transcriptional regulator MalT
MVKELEEARVEMNDAAVKAKEVDAELKAIHEEERILVRKAEQALVKVDGELNEALDQMKLIKKMKRERYINFGSLWSSLLPERLGRKLMVWIQRSY